MRVIITPKAQKHYTHMSEVEKKKIKKKLLQLESDPFAGKKAAGELEEMRSLKAWPYRIIYYIDTKKKCLYITSILHRQGAYK